MASIVRRRCGKRRVRLALTCALGCLFVLPATWLDSAHAPPAGAATTSWTAYVVDQGSNSVMPINTATNVAGSSINLPGTVTDPQSIAIDPSATTAYVTAGNNYLVPIDLATGAAQSPISLPGLSGGEEGVSLTPDGTTALVAEGGATDFFDPVDLATSTPGSPITVGSAPSALAVTPDGTAAYVTDPGSAKVWPVALPGGAVGTAIPVGGEPNPAVIDPNGSTVFVPDSSDHVSVISTASNAVTATIPVGSGPDGIAVSPDGSTVYVANLASDNVSVIDAATDAVTATIPVGAAPEGMAVTPDGRTVYVTNIGDGTVSVIDAATDTVTATVDVGGPGSDPVAIAITPDQAPVAAVTVTPGDAGNPTTFDASSSTVTFGTIASYNWNFGDGSSTTTATPTTSHVYTAAGNYTAAVTETSSGGTSVIQAFTGQTLSRNGGVSATTSVAVTVSDEAPRAAWNAYVVCQGTNNVVPLDTGDDVAGVPIPLQAGLSNAESIAINPMGTIAYVSDFFGDGVTPIDLTRGKPLPFVSLTGTTGGTFGTAISPDGSTALVANEADNSVDTVDVAGEAQGTNSYPAGNKPSSLAVTPNGAFAYVASNSNETVTPVNLANGADGKPIPVGNIPYSVAVTPDGSEVFVANAGSGTVSVISTTTNQVTDTLNVGTTPQSLAVSSNGAAVYVGNEGSDTVSVINTANNSVTTPISLALGAGPSGLALTPDGSRLYVANSGDSTVSVVDTATDAASTVFVGLGCSEENAIAVTPDQAPHAATTAVVGEAGNPTTFDASSSTVPVGTIASYDWNFGDGTDPVTTTPTTSHVYAAACTYTATVTETSSGGTSTAQVFSGQTMINNGAPTAATSISVTVPAAPEPSPPPGPPQPTPTPTPTPHPAPPPTPGPTPTPAPTPEPHPVIPPHLITNPNQVVSPPHPHPHPHPHPQPHPPNPLLVVPTSGTPGMAVSLTDRRLSKECQPSRTVYVFFDNQLVAQAQAVGRSFSDTDVVLPGDATSGAHQFALSCTQAVTDPRLAFAPFRVDGAANHPMGWITSLPHPGNQHGSVSTWFKSTLIAGGLLALLLLFLGAPAEWFNDTYDANKERMMAAARRRFPTMLASRGHATAHWWRTLRAPMLFAAFLAVAALFQGFLDPSFGWDTSSLWLFLGWCAGVAVVTLGFQLLSVIAGVRTKHRVRFQVLVGSIVVGGLCVLASRALGLEPGYCYGLIAVFALLPVLPEAVSGRLAAGSSLVVLALSAASYGLFVLVSRAASHPHPSPALLVLQAGLGVVFVLGVESVSFGLLPLPFLPGRDVVQWNRWAWGALFGVGMVAFIWILLQPGSGVASEINHVDLIPVAAACAAFTVIALAFMAYFRFRKPQGVIGEEDAPVGLVD